MKALLYLAAMATCVATSVDPIYVPPEHRMGVSVVSSRILVVEVTEIIRKPAQISEGIEISTLVVKGKVIDVIRGDDKDKLFNHSCDDFRVVDQAAFKKVHGETDMFNGPPQSKETGAGDCKVGERYVVLDSNYMHRVYFVRIAKGDESWRSKILILDQKLLTEEKTEQKRADQPATKAVDKPSKKDPPSIPTSKVAPR